MYFVVCNSTKQDHTDTKPCSNGKEIWEYKYWKLTILYQFGIGSQFGPKWYYEQENLASDLGLIVRINYVYMQLIYFPPACDSLLFGRTIWAVVFSYQFWVQYVFLFIFSSIWCSGNISKLLGNCRNSCHFWVRNVFLLFCGSYIKNLHWC